ncbi:MAG: arginine--tRNA ligase [SAR324 cluster bacterium]|nr:arginine--tRNA ligase [SAR324 cluster bacterium]
MRQNIYQELLLASVIEAYQKAFKQKLTEIFFEKPPQPKYGDIAIACFGYAQNLKIAPHLIAQSLANELNELADKNSQFKATALGAYINFKFPPKIIAKKIFTSFVAGEFNKVNLGGGQKILIEFSAPNANKPLHLGHGRNNAIGVFLVRLAKVLGFSVTAANLVNDRGIHICKSMLAYKIKGEGQTPETKKQKGDHFVGDYYVEFAKLAKEDPIEYNKQAQNLLLLWEQGDKGTIALWKKMTSWVLAGFETTYRRSGVEFDHYYYESETYKGGKEIVLKALEDGICYTESNGAVAIDLSEEGLGTKILLRGDKTSVYITQDIYTTTKKFNDHKANMAFWVVGNEQEHHFKVLFAILRKLGYHWAKQCHHVSYGMINLPDGKMKSREGNTVDLDDLYNQMQESAYDLIKQREFAEKREEHELKEVADKVGQAAINFFILKSASTKDIVFNRKESLSFDGMTGPYLQYTFARMTSLLEKANRSEIKIEDIDSDVDWSQEEVMLLRQGVFFVETLQISWKDKNPGPVAHYAYDLCRLYNRFYYLYPIIKQKEVLLRENRINLTILCRDILRQCLYLLNIEALDRM